jgi:hypothetical protein
VNVGIEARAALVNLGLAAAVLAAAFLLSGLPPREIALLLLKVQALLCGGLLAPALGWICVLGLLLLVLGSYVWFLVRLP